jgi:Fe-S cluster assembly protein SufD
MMATVIETDRTQALKNFYADPNEPEWLRDLRREAFLEFSDRGYPTVRHEDWKYTNVAPVIGSMTVGFGRNGHGSLKEPTSDERRLIEQFNFQRNGFTAENLARANLVSIVIDGETSETIELDSHVEGGSAVFPHRLITVRSGTSATLIETYSSKAANFTNAAMQIVVEDNARLTHYRVQKESSDAFHYGVTEVSVGREATYNSTNINLGGKLSRHDIELKFTAEGGEAWVDGLYMLNGTQHADTHSIIDHQVPNCTSHQNYKGVLSDRSRAVFNGKVFVRENAYGTDAQQQNKNLLLSNEARVDTKPQLEIFNDDVKCSHGATVGQLEEEELFYLLTRGLPETLARNLLTYGFAEEIINKIGVEKIKSELDISVLHRLSTVL